MTSELTNEYLDYLDEDSSRKDLHHILEYNDEVYYIDYIFVYDSIEGRKVVKPIAICTIDEEGRGVEYIPMPHRIYDAAVEEIEKEIEQYA